MEGGREGRGRVRRRGRKGKKEREGGGRIERQGRREERDSVHLYCRFFHTLNMVGIGHVLQCTDIYHATKSQIQFGSW